MTALDEMIDAIGQDNLGATAVTYQLLELRGRRVIDDYLELLKQNIRGADLWCLYKDCCGEDVTTLHRVIMQRKCVEMLKQVPASSFYVGVRARVLEE